MLQALALSPLLSHLLARCSGTACKHGYRTRSYEGYADKYVVTNVCAGII